MVAEVEIKLGQLLGEQLLGIGVELQQRVAKMLSVTLLVGELGFLNHDTIHVGDEAQGFRIGHLGMFHQKGDAVAALAATETFVDVSRRIDVEGPSLLIVEGTAGNIIIASFPQGEKTRYNLFNMSGIFDALYGVGTDH